MPTALAQSGATIVGQVTVNGTATNGVLVTCGSSSNTTFTYQGTPGYYFVSGIPYNTSLPFSATYNGESYTDTVDPLSSGQAYYQLPAVNIVPKATVVPTPVPNATATPAPNATATPAPNSTITPTPAANVTATATPVPPVATPVPTYSATMAPMTVTATPVPAIATPTAVPSISPTVIPAQVSAPTAVPSPTQTKSPGFQGLLALSALLGAAYLVLRKGR